MNADPSVVDSVDGEKSEQVFEPDRQTMPVNDEAAPRLAFPVVGIGASAGGLEAVTEFLSTVRVDSGMAYVFVQHLPPAGESMLPDILSKRTILPVLHVEEGLAVLPNHLYVIRPGRTLCLEYGKFRLGERLERPMGNRPIDDFLKSLAEDMRERAIAVILSGMGSNGSAGCQAIKAVGGLCIAQDPESAQYPSMPRHLIEAGYADYILRAPDMADVLLTYAGHPYARDQREDHAELRKTDIQYVRDILAILRTRTRQDFNGYKKATVLRRIQRRLGLGRLENLKEYAAFLRQSPAEVAALADDLLIHVTGFFRDPEAWEALRQQVIVPLVNVREPNDTIRCWVTACSSGEEAYTLAMLLVEESERANKTFDIKVFATDMAERTLQNARLGLYPGGIESEIEPQRLERFFTREDEVYRVRQELRARVIFAPQNVLQDPPFSRLDIVTCRNLLIYLEPQTQQRILSLLHFGLREGGTLFLGTSETPGTEEYFQAIDKKARIYRRLRTAGPRMAEFPLPHAVPVPGGHVAGQSPETASGGPRISIAQRSTRALLADHTPPAVTIDRDYKIVYYHGNTEPFIGAARGEPTRDLMHLVRQTLRGAVRTAIHRAMAELVPVTEFDGWLEGEPGSRVRVAVTASPLDSKTSSDGLVVISFHEQAPPFLPDISPKLLNGDGSEELRIIRDELQSTIEEFQTANEELKASHEEVVSMNEELQSTNEELETSREEMQSLNEELSTVNAQLLAKMEEHSAAHNDLASLLTSTDIAVIFLDSRFRIRRFTPKSADLINLAASDIGRPVEAIARKFTDSELAPDLQKVLATLMPVEREVSNDAGRWYLRRATPYRTTDDHIEGVVVVFIDITARRDAEQAIRLSEEQFRKAIDEAPIPVIMQAEDGQVLQISKTWSELTGYELADLPDIEAWLRHAYGTGADIMRNHVHELFRGSRRSLNVRLGFRRSDGSERLWSFSASSPGLLHDGRRYIVGMAVDITDRSGVEDALRESEERFRLLVEGATDFAMLMLSPAGKITMWNEGAQRLLGWTTDEAVGQDGAMIFTPEDRANAAPDRERFIAAQDGRAVDERWHLKKDGTRFWGSGVMTSLKSGDGTLRGYVKILRDQTIRRRADEVLLAAKQASEDANTLKDQFLATLSHELRTPLSTILLWSRILQNNASTGVYQNVDAGLAAIVAGAETQKELIEDLLDISRITSGHLRLKMQEVDLLALIQGCIAATVPSAEAKTISIVSDLSGDVGFVLSDPERLRQIVCNLLTNAVKFSEPGGRIDVQLKRRNGDVEIRVADNGKGIEAEFLPHVFDAFRQADQNTTRRYGGLGLGLSIVKQLVELHGGGIEAHSKGLGKGATFIVKLPLPNIQSKAQRPKKSATASADGSEDTNDLSGVSILLLEDEPATRDALALVLRNSGAVVREADTSLAAFALYKEERPDLIVSDIGLPNEDGYAFIRRVRNFESSNAAATVPAVALTAFVRETDRRAALDAGFTSHLGKPVEPNQLREAVLASIR